MRWMAMLMCVLGITVTTFAADVVETPRAARSRALLAKKVTLNFKNEFLHDIFDEIRDQVRGTRFKVDAKGGVSGNRRLSIQCKDVPLAEALEMLLGPADLDYLIISDPISAYDGVIFIKQGAWHMVY